MTAIYYQKTTNSNLEYHLVEVTTIRETFLSKYKSLEKAVLERRRIFNDECILEMLQYLNQIRITTFQLFEHIIEWQKLFVKAKRPNLLNKDYLLDIITSTEFINSSRIRKHLNFAVMRGNIFILPLSTGKPRELISVTPEIKKEVELFANPDMDRLILAYTVLQKSLPKKYFKNILSLSRWIHSIWMPNIQVISSPAPPLLPTLPSASASSPSKRPLSAPSKSRQHQKNSKSPSSKSNMKKSSTQATNLQEPMTQQSLSILSQSVSPDLSLPPTSHISHSHSSQPSLHTTPAAASLPPNQPQSHLHLDLHQRPPPAGVLKSSPSKKILQPPDVIKSPKIKVKLLTSPPLSPHTSRLSSNSTIPPQNNSQNISVLPILSTSQLREWYLQNHQPSS